MIRNGVGSKVGIPLGQKSREREKGKARRKEQRKGLIPTSYWTSAMTLRSSCASMEGSSSSGRLHNAQKNTPVIEDICRKRVFLFLF